MKKISDHIFFGTPQGGTFQECERNETIVGVRRGIEILLTKLSIELKFM